MICSELWDLRAFSRFYLSSPKVLFCLYVPDDGVAPSMLCDIIMLYFPLPSSLLFGVFYVFCSFVSRLLVFWRNTNSLTAKWPIKTC